MIFLVPQSGINFPGHRKKPIEKGVMDGTTVTWHMTKS